jgi:hypothetical protein
MSSPAGPGAPEGKPPESPSDMSSRPLRHE